jgi:hypothetical protein
MGLIIRFAGLFSPLGLRIEVPGKTFSPDILDRARRGAVQSNIE